MATDEKPDEADVSVSQAEVVREILRNHEDERQAFEQWLSSAAPGMGVTVVPVRLQTWREHQLINAFLESREDIRVEQAPEGETPASSELAFRLGPDRVFHLRSALRVVLIDGLGLFFAFATPSGFVALFYSWFVFSGIDIVRRFMRCFERISDPQEKLVFEVLYELQNRRVAEVADDDPAAGIEEKRSRVSVGADTIAQRLAGELTTKEVRALLRGMAAREVVTERHGLWSISFW